MNTITLTLALPLTAEQTSALLMLSGGAVPATAEDKTEEKQKRAPRGSKAKAADAAPPEPTPADTKAEAKAAAESLARITAAVKKGLENKKAMGISGLKAIFGGYNAEKFPDLKPEDYDAVATEIEEALAMAI